MTKLTEEQAIIIMGYTGVATCNFEDFHNDVEARLDRPVWTHQFPELMDEIKKEYKEDFLALLPTKVLAEG